MMPKLEKDQKRTKLPKQIRGKLAGFSTNVTAAYILRIYLLFVLNCGLKNFKVV